MKGVGTVMNSAQLNIQSSNNRTT